MHKIRATFGSRPKESSVRIAALYLAFFFIVVSVTQLFAFEKYPDIIMSYGLPIGADFSLVIAAILVSCEVLAIPFLLFMKLSPLMRAVSAVSGVVALVFWLAVGVWQNLVHESIPNAGLFGATITAPQGWWLVTYITALLILYILVLLGVREKRKKK